MGFRTVVVSSRCKCSYKNGYMVLQNTDIKMVHLSEIDSVIFETVAVSISGVLLSELCKKKVRICNFRKNGMVIPESRNAIPEQTE